MNELIAILEGTDTAKFLINPDDYVKNGLEQVVEKVSSEKTHGGRISQYCFAFTDFSRGFEDGFNKKTENGNGFYSMGFEYGSKSALDFDSALTGCKREDLPEKARLAGKSIMRLREVLDRVIGEFSLLSFIYGWSYQILKSEFEKMRDPIAEAWHASFSILDVPIFEPIEYPGGIHFLISKGDVINYLDGKRKLTSRERIVLGLIDLQSGRYDSGTEHFELAQFESEPLPKSIQTLLANPVPAREIFNRAYEQLQRVKEFDRCRF